jgi:hypothetical protein
MGEHGDGVDVGFLAKIDDFLGPLAIPHVGFYVETLLLQPFLNPLEVFLGFTHHGNLGLYLVLPGEGMSQGDSKQHDLRLVGSRDMAAFNLTGQGMQRNAEGGLFTKPSNITSFLLKVS